MNTFAPTPLNDDEIQKHVSSDATETHHHGVDIVTGGNLTINGNNIFGDNKSTYNSLSGSEFLDLFFYSLG